MPNSFYNGIMFNLSGFFGALQNLHFDTDSLLISPMKTEIFVQISVFGSLPGSNGQKLSAKTSK